MCIYTQPQHKERFGCCMDSKGPRKLPQSTMTLILKDVTGFFQDMLLDLQDDVNACLSSAGIDCTSVPGLAQLFDPQSSEYATPFSGLETSHNHMKYCREALGYVEPQPILLGTEKQWKGTGEKRTYAEVRNEMMYIPILQTIQNLLENPEVLNQVQSGHTSTDGVLRDYCDGSHCSSHPLLSVDRKFLQIFLYCDDVEVCNPIGSKRIIHKLGLFYFVLGNISPMFRSKTKHIQLVAIAKVEDVKKYGSNAVLKPFIKDVMKLEKGHTFTVGGVSQTLWGSVCVVPGDNLASNLLGGFKEGSTAHRGCRQRLATPAEMRSIFTESHLQLRSYTDHKQKCEELENAATARAYQNLSKEYGINHNSVLNDLKYFNVCSGGLVQDVMHDVLEGVLEYEVKELLLYHIDGEGYYTLDFLNQQIIGLELGYMESKDRPSTISVATLRSKDHKLKQQAAQMWLLGRLLPQMVGYKIPDDDDNWRNFLDLLQIVDLFLAPELTKDDVALSATLVSDHHLEFKNLYPHASKMHYLVHMPRLILQYGPLRQLWTMRFEGKHSYFKKLTQSIGNFINLPLTLAHRHQKLQCYNRMDSTSYCSDLVTFGPGTVVSACAAPRQVTRLGGEIMRVNWLEVNGTVYKQPSVVVLRMESEHPKFAKLVDTFVVNSKRAILHVQPLKTLDFIPHFHCYTVDSSLCESPLYISVQSLFTHIPHHLRVLPGSFGTLCIVPHHLFVTNFIVFQCFVLHYENFTPHCWDMYTPNT